MSQNHDGGKNRDVVNRGEAAQGLSDSGHHKISGGHNSIPDKLAKALKRERAAVTTARRNLHQALDVIEPRLAAAEATLQRLAAEHGRIMAEMRRQLAPVETLAEEVAALHQRLEDFMRGE